MSRKYTEEFLISELQRFYKENGRIPTQRDMIPENGYPAAGAYAHRFGSFNNSLIRAGFRINKVNNRLNGTEICSYCGKRADEIPNFIGWVYPNGIRYCRKHGGGGGLRDYVKGELDINSTTGLGRAGEILVLKTLEIGDEFDCNKISCGYKIDLYHDEYKKIDVKTSIFNCKYNNWFFNFKAKKEVHTYICIALSSDRKDVEHVWIVPNEDYIRNLQTFGIYDTYVSLYTHKHWEVNNKPYDNVWQTMKLKTCKIMVDKSKYNYIEQTKLCRVVDDTSKQVEQVIDTLQHKLTDFK